MSQIEEAMRKTIISNLGVIEGNLLLHFVDNKIREGYYYTRVPLCDGHFRMDVLCVKNIDRGIPISVLGEVKGLKRHLTGLRGHSGYIIEIKEKLNFEALGQVIIDMHYFPSEYPNIPIEGYGILCSENDEEIQEVCKRYGIMVHVV